MPSAAYTTASNSELPTITIVYLVTVTAGATVLRMCTDAVDFVSRGETYRATGTAMRAQLYDDREDRPPRARIRFENLTGFLLEGLRNLDPMEDTNVTIEMVTSDEPDTVQDAWIEAVLRDVTYNSMELEGEVSADNVLAVAAPAMSYDPANFPALHAGVP